MGQAAYLSRHHKIYTSYQIGFYVSVPGLFCFFFLFQNQKKFSVSNYALVKIYLFAHLKIILRQQVEYHSLLKY